MRTEQQMIGGAAVGVLDQLDKWEAVTVKNLRLWCESCEGQTEVWETYRKSLPPQTADAECRAFERLIHNLLGAAHRPLVRHGVGCGCLGADEAVFLHLIRTASLGHHRDAALIATLLVGAGQAEAAALLARQVGRCARHMNHVTPEISPRPATSVVRLH